MWNRTNGAVIFASGSPYKTVEFEGKTYEPGQGNNFYMFGAVHPSTDSWYFVFYIILQIGFGTILSKAKYVTDGMVETAAIALASSLTPEEDAIGLVYPRIARIREISIKIVLGVIRKAQEEVRRLVPLVLPYRSHDHCKSLGSR